VTGLLPAGVRRVLVVGLGKVTGKAVARALASAGVEVRVSEAAATALNRQSAAELEGFGISVHFGEPDLALLDWAHLVVPSPGVPPTNPFLANAAQRGIKIWSEIEVGSRIAKGPLTAITGTNGKTTTTTLLARMLQQGGRPCVAAGNIGFPLVEAAASAPAGSHLVCEVSSFQLAFVEQFHPGIAVILNIADDHYDWHSGRDDYVRAKARISENQTADDLLLIRADDSACARIASDSRASIGAFGLTEPESLSNAVQKKTGRELMMAGGIVGSQLVLHRNGKVWPLVEVGDIRLQGPHNLENVLAAALSAAHAGIDLPAIAQAATEFEDLPHRSSLIAEVKGVRYIDDSKATNPHATLSALKGLKNVILVAGGRAKGLDLSSLKPVAHAAKQVLVMGEAADKLREVFGNDKCVYSADVEQAVVLASEMAAPGDTVLLSPACSSLDQYTDYAERGNRFIKAVMALA